MRVHRMVASARRAGIRRPAEESTRIGAYALNSNEMHRPSHEDRIMEIAAVDLMSMENRSGRSIPSTRLKACRALFNAPNGSAKRLRRMHESIRLALRDVRSGGLGPVIFAAIRAFEKAPLC